MPEVVKGSVECRRGVVARSKPHPDLIKPTSFHQGKDRIAYLEKASGTREKSFEVLNLGKISGHSAMCLSKSGHFQVQVGGPFRTYFDC